MSEAVARGIATPEPSAALTRSGGWILSARRSDRAFTVSDATPLSKVLARSARGGSLDALFATRVGLARWEDDRLITCVAPGEWLVIGPPSEAPAVLPPRWHEAVAAADGIVVDVSHGRAALRVRGDGTAELLGRICAIDVARRSPLSTLRTHIAGVVSDVIVLDRGARSVLIHVDRSYGAYLLRTVLERGTDLGIDLDGSQPWTPATREPVDG